MAYQILAFAVLVVHTGFAVWVYCGGFIARRSRRLVLLHAASGAWALIAVSGELRCPLTLLENELRALGGAATYSEECIPHYFWGPLNLPRTEWTPLLLIAPAILLNVIAYRPRCARRTG